MKKYLNIIILVFGLIGNAQTNYIRILGTYYGDDTMVVRDSNTDSEGNIIIIGNIKSTENTIQYNVATLNAHQDTFAGGLSDGFIAKFTAEGALLWATYFGGESEDLLTNSTIDRNDDIVLIGTTKSSTGIATLDSFQPSKVGIKDNFVAKLNKNGILLWCTYYGGEDFNDSSLPDEFNAISGFACLVTNSNGEIFVATTTPSSIDMATEGVFQEFIYNNNSTMIVKFSETGERQWATFYGVNVSQIYSLQCDIENVYVLGTNYDCPPLIGNSYFSTDGSYQPTNSSCVDVFISKFNVESGNRIWSTYYGGLNQERLFKKSLKLFKNHLYIVGQTASNTNITTSNSFQPIKAPGSSIFISKFTTTTGQLVWGTYYGNFIENQTTRHIGINAFDDHLYIFGQTDLASNFTTPNSYQENFSGGGDGFLLKFTTDGERDWATYFGGWSEDRVDNVLFKEDAIFLLGMTKSSQNISTPNGMQPNLLNYGDPNLGAPSNIFIAKLEPNVLSLQENLLGKPTVFPNPNQGSFTLVLPSASEGFLEIYNVLGKKIHQEKVNSNQVISTVNWSKGIYFAKITSENAVFETVKIIVE